MLVFITSTSKDLYKRDMLNVSCKLTNDLISFSYNKDRIHHNVPTAVKGKEALILFAEYKPSSSPKFVFHPTRYCTIEEPIDNAENASFTYHLKLKDCVKYKHDLTNKQINNDFLLAINDEITKQLDEGIDNLKYYFRDIEIKTAIGKGPIEETGVWPNLAKHLGNLDIFKESIFFRQLATEDGIDFKETDLKLRKPIRLKSGKIYSLSFLVVAGSEVKGSGLYPTIETSENVSTQGPFISQESNAIALRYLLITGSAASQTYSSFVMKAKQEPPSTSPVSPEISNYFIITPGRWLSVTTVCLILLGLIGPNIAELIPKDKIIVFLGAFPVKGANLIIGIKLFASVTVAAGTYFAYKKIPKSE